MADTTVSANRLELLQIADAVARDKAIDKSVVLQAMEDAIQRAARSRYGQENEIRAEIDAKSGEIRLNRLLMVVDKVENDATQISIVEARNKNPAANLGDFIAEPLPPVDFGRIAAQNAKQVIVQKVRDAERERQYNEFKDRIGEIVHGVVKRVEYGNVIVDLGRGEAIVRRDETLPRETFRNGDRIRAYVYDVRREQRGPQIFLSRTHPEFMARLFAQEVPEIYDGVVEVVSVARDPGSRAKIAVRSKESSIDPVGACVGMRGSRVQAVVNELQGEKIDIIPWSPDAAAFIVNALAPAEVAKVVLDEESERIEVVVPDEQLSLAIGRRGQNVRLASQLTGWDIDILTEAEESERRQKEFAERTQRFMSALDVDEMLAQLLASEGFSSVEDVAFVATSELASLEGLDQDTAAELQERAKDYLDRRSAELDKRRRELGVSDELKDLDGMTSELLVALGEAGILALDDLAGSATDELVGWTRAQSGRDGPPQGFAERTRRYCGRRRAHHNGGPRQGRLDRTAQSTGRNSNDGGRKLIEAMNTLEGPAISSRKCIMSGEEHDKADLIRFVLGPGNEIVPDLQQKLPGRGVWLAADRRALERALAENRFSKAFKAKCRVDPELPARIEDLIRREARQYLALANKAGLVVAGYEKTADALAQGRARLLIEAADGAEDGRRKLRAKRPEGCEIVAIFASHELDLALGRANVIHAAVAKGGLAEKLLSAARRVEAFGAGTGMHG